MQRTTLSILIPPLAVCRYGCAGCCAAPIGVFWLAGIVSIIYGYLGGPAGLETISWTTVALGLGLWIIASVWAMMAIRGVKDDECQRKRSTVCRMVSPAADERDPLEDIKKFSN
ncbi:MAG: hypothetical protein P8Z75_02505 [Gammaproteobacteria bacterium]|jgi:hypothetical protein